MQVGSFMSISCLCFILCRVGEPSLEQQTSALDDMVKQSPSLAALKKNIKGLNGGKCSGKVCHA